jgi:hypothetical protein
MKVSRPRRVMTFPSPLTHPSIPPKCVYYQPANTRVANGPCHADAVSASLTTSYFCVCACANGHFPSPIRVCVRSSLHYITLAIYQSMNYLHLLSSFHDRPSTHLGMSSYQPYISFHQPSLNQSVNNLSIDLVFLLSFFSPLLATPPWPVLLHFPM